MDSQRDLTERENPWPGVSFDDSIVESKILSVATSAKSFSSGRSITSLRTKKMREGKEI